MGAQWQCRPAGCGNNDAMMRATPSLQNLRQVKHIRQSGIMNELGGFDEVATRVVRQRDGDSGEDP